MIGKSVKRFSEETMFTLKSYSALIALQPSAIAAASAAARCMLEDISLVTVLCSSTAAAVEVTYSLTP